MAQYNVPPDRLRSSGPGIIITLNGSLTLALLDTGASFSYVDIVAAERLKAPVVAQHDAAGATGDGTYPTFELAFHIPQLDVLVPSPVRALPLKQSGHIWDATVGRDVLTQFEFCVDGRTGQITFA